MVKHFNNVRAQFWSRVGRRAVTLMHAGLASGLRVEVAFAEAAHCALQKRWSADADRWGRVQAA